MPHDPADRPPIRTDGPPERYDPEMNEISETRKIVFFGCPLDCDERAESIEEKHAVGPGGASLPNDPYGAVMARLRGEIPEGGWSELGSLRVPAWLMPVPGDLSRTTVENFVAFLDDGGCRRFAEEAGRLVSERILPEVPCLIGVDHAVTGGVVKALADRHGTENLSLIVLDSHTDAIPMAVVADAIQYDIDTNPASHHDRNDPYLHGRPDSYNASSFIHHLLAEGTVLPENLFLIGVGDYPEKRALRIKDPRIARYVAAYTGIRRGGATIVTKKECLAGASKLKTLLRKVKTPYVYVSVDMDIGSRNAVEGVRFRDRQGLQEKQIHRIIEAITGLFSKGIRLAGLDITEINPRRAGVRGPEGEDRTYRIAADLIKMLAFGR